MELAILYETGEGQTRKIVGVIADQVRALGYEVTVIDAAEAMPEGALERADKVILAAPVHERRHPRAFETALTAAREPLAKMPTLMLSVSLKAAFAEGMDEAQDYLTEMKMRTGLQPTQEALVAGAVRAGSYDYFQSQIVKHVVLDGQDVDVSEGETEFTDWAALEKTVAGFLDR